MSRTSVHRALVLAVRRSGESNREAVFLTADSGILRATLFGGPKSKLKAHVAPFHSGELQLYRDPVKDYRKVVDFDVREWRPGLREQLERSYAASAIAETITESHGGGGSWATGLDLALETLDALQAADANGGRIVLLRFLWKWTDFLGARPELDSCAACACDPAADEVVWYSRREGGVACASCAAESGRGPIAEDTDGTLPVGPGARAWLRALDGLDARASLRTDADAVSARQARRLVSAALADALGVRPKTWTALEATS